MISVLIRSIFCLVLAGPLLAGAQGTGPADGEGGEFSVRQQGDFIVLKNGRDLRVMVSPEHGGELTGFAIQIGDEWQDVIYRAGDYREQDGWRGKAMTLWPAVGTLYDANQGKHHYTLDGITRRMPAHGFARHHPWAVVYTEATSGAARVRLELGDSEQTREAYPFGFTLQVEYSLERDRLQMSYILAAAGDNARPMPFTIGNHVTFKAPMIGVGQAAEVRFLANLPDRLVRDGNNVFAGEVTPSEYSGWRTLAELPHRYAASLGGPPGPSELWVEDPSGLRIRLSHSASAYPAAPSIQFNLWADTEEGFFSPEPWLGTQNALNTGFGLLHVAPGETWSWSIEIEPEPAGQPPATEDRR